MMNHMIQMMKQLSSKLSPSVYTSSQQRSAAERMSHLRQIQRELKQEDVLDKPFKDLPFIIFDLETSGFNPDRGDSILSIGAIRMKGTNILEEETFYSTVQTKKAVSTEVLKLTGLTNEELQQSPPLIDVLTQFYTFTGGTTLVAHHASHEKKFMSHATWQTLRTTFAHRLVDTSFLTKVVAPYENLITLDECCEYHCIPVANRHHALEDAIMTAKLWRENLFLAERLGFYSLRDVYLYLAKGNHTK
ncbi:exonuclease [Alkalihalobacillus alcalophilus ATCC 27647 = CGMCC 1.3604]|uniref:Exonuclease n=2 Tax=Alkalihalobacillus alcalophilus ATCC 27647 = CGMCC 1.3604 TaxID=1218173 RepID=A0A4S4K089_ALKAL|nr:exonuclease domain-containing protein [Alkalihalobacillus alcalophilus]MED1564036.1 exonuclease domain-containing protein [Alkalihalobacillus alcalophilus]THG90961.1 exonuclease [Alkalihalobacillus alcalophilus ATCC 27647 = CGMCC 1.3604]